jgi:hypothetical protein
MRAYQLCLALAATGLIALTLAWPDTPTAQQTAPAIKSATPPLVVAPPKAIRCYNPPQTPAKTTPLSKLPPPGLCLGVISGTNCTVCPGHPSGQVIQIVAGKAVTCYKGCSKGYVWNAYRRLCCPGTPSAPPLIK